MKNKFVMNINIFRNVQTRELQIIQGASFQQNLETNEKNKGILKKILYWIYIFTLFFAALLTCLFYLGWLEPIKTFISRILLNK